MKHRISQPHQFIYRVVLAFFIFASTCFFGTAFASSSQNLGSIATNLTSSFGALAQLITAISYIAGLGFAVAAIFKFKAHKDNPQQTPIGAPLALLFIGAALIFMPSIFSVAGQTLFGSGATSGGVSGVSSFT